MYIIFRSDVDSLSQLKDVIDKSAESNTALRVTHGLEWYDWKQYFQTKIKHIHGIMKSQSFRFTATNPGDVFIRENLDSAERCLHILQVFPDVFENFDARRSQQSQTRVPIQAYSAFRQRRLQR